MKRLSLAPSLVLIATAAFPTLRAVGAEKTKAQNGAPRIQFETNFVDLGKVTAAEGVSGSFKFKNTGDGMLKVDPPQASCDCTVAKVTPDSLAPGESGEVSYIIKLDRPLSGQRMIHVHSNDPQTPDTQLTIQLDYTPLYKLSPGFVLINLPAGKEEMAASFSISRGDGKPLGVERVTGSQPWITAAFEPGTKPEESFARINVVVHRPAGPPGPFNGKVQMWGTNETAHPVQSIVVAGEAQGELVANPPKLYWVIPDFGTNKAAYPAEALMRKVELKSILGHDVEIKSATNTVKGMTARVTPKQAGRAFDLILKFDELPEGLQNGKVTLETSLASLPRLEIPITIAAPANN